MPATRLTIESAPSAATRSRASGIPLTLGGAHGDGGGFGCQGCSRDLGFSPQLHPAACLQLPPQHVTEMPVADGIAKCIELVLLGVQACEAEAASIGDVDVANRRRFARQRRPDIEGLIDLTRAVAERRGAAHQAGVARAHQSAHFRSAPPSGRCQRAPAPDSHRPCRRRQSLLRTQPAHCPWASSSPP